MRDCNERRAEIMRILIARRSETQATLAAELGVLQVVQEQKTACQ